MIELNEPQVWTLIGVFAAALFGMMTLMFTMFMRVLDSKFERVDAQFERVDAQFTTIHHELEHLNRDVQALVRRVFPEHD